MNGLPWYRQYWKEIDDPRLRLLAFEDRYHFMAFKMLKAKGVLDTPAEPVLFQRLVAVALGVQVRELEEIARRISEVGLIDRLSFQPLDWDVEQAPYKSDQTATERKRRQRQRQREAREDSIARVTAGSRVTVTAVTDGDIDRDEELEKSSEETTTSDSLDTTFLSGVDPMVVVGILDEFGSRGASRQDLADELAGALRKGIIKTSWPGWFRSTVANARDSDFRPNHGLEIQKERDRRVADLAACRRRKEAEVRSHARRNDPERQAAVARWIAEGKEAIAAMNASKREETDG